MLKALVGARVAIGIVTMAAVSAMSACTTKNQEAPPLSGPSELGQSLAVAANPDSIPQDGASQSFVSVTVRDANGQPMRNVTLRAEIVVNGVLVDFGRLSARSIVTGGDGRASLIYTAPSAPAAAVDTFTIVDITVTPSGTDFNNANSRSAAIRLTPPDIVIPPINIVPSFTVTPGAPEIGQTVLFDATASSGQIVEYSWNFGDGGRGSGRTTQYSYDESGTVVVTLTVSDAFGRSRSTSQSITVGVGARPVAAFIFSPAAPRANQSVNFNASGSTSPTSRIVSYTWDFGDGSPIVTVGQATIAHTFTGGATTTTYNVTLVVRDEAGRTSVGTTVPVPINP